MTATPWLRPAPGGPVRWLPAALVAVAGGLVALGAAYAPGATVAALLALVGVGGVLALVTVTPRGWRRIWFGVVIVAAFGPFIDVITHQPFNWLFGSAILLFALMCVAEPVIRGVIGRSSRWPRVSYPWALGGASALYCVYFLLQALRPDVDPMNGLLGWRTPLIGLAGYAMTRFAFREPLSQEQVAHRVGQFLWVFVCISIPVALYGIFQFVVGLDRLTAWGLVESAEMVQHFQRNLEGGGLPIFRIFSTFRRSEQFGTFLYMCVVAAATSLRLGRRPRWLIFTSIGVCLVALMLALSLTNIVGLVIWLGALVVLTRSWRLALLAFAVFTLLVIAGVAINEWLNGLIGVRVAEHILDTQEGVGRVQMSINWMLELGDRGIVWRLFGSGICTGLDEPTLRRIQDVFSAIGISPGALFACAWSREIHDNWYATHSLEIGLVGLGIIWLLYLIVLVYTVPRVRRFWGEPYRGGYTILAAGVVALWPSGFVGALVTLMPMTIYFSTFLALLDVVSRRPPTLAERPAIGNGRQAPVTMRTASLVKS